VRRNECLNSPLPSSPLGWLFRSSGPCVVVPLRKSVTVDDLCATGAGSKGSDASSTRTSSPHSLCFLDSLTRTCARADPLLFPLFPRDFSRRRRGPNKKPRTAADLAEDKAEEERRAARKAKQGRLSLSANAVLHFLGAQNPSSRSPIAAAYVPGQPFIAHLAFAPGQAPRSLVSERKDGPEGESSTQGKLFERDLGRRREDLLRGAIPRAGPRSREELAKAIKLRQD
jgi:hypothetical protein